MWGQCYKDSELSKRTEKMTASRAGSAYAVNSPDAIQKYNEMQGDISNRPSNLHNTITLFRYRAINSFKDKKFMVLPQSIRLTFT